jgi:hypothetical protein
MKNQYRGLFSSFTRSRLVGRRFLVPYQDRARSVNLVIENLGCLKAYLDAFAVAVVGDVQVVGVEALAERAEVVEDRGSNED